MGNPEDKAKRYKRRKNFILRDLHKRFKQKDHSDEVYDRKINRIDRKRLQEED